MKLLLDTHVLLWAIEAPKRLDKKTATLLNSEANPKWFSVVSLWEIGVKRGLRRQDFLFDARLLRKQLLARGFSELGLTAEHTLAINQLPPLHRDPFDRMLLCQALVEGLTLVTGDELVVQYPMSILRV
jgi:PIN domain nuclease of toxin-antitoxin system